MNRFQLSAIYIYPIKSLGGISLTESAITETGLLYDRKWVLIDESNTFITQRKYPLLSLLRVSVTDGNITVTHQENATLNISFPVGKTTGNPIPVTIWDDLTEGIEVDEKVSEWFSGIMNRKVRLVSMPEQVRRIVDPEYAVQQEIVSFADGYPCLIIGQASLDQLNEKLETPVLMDRFRPNFVFTGGEPHAEDAFESFEIGNISFSAVKPCARCVLITVNQQTAVKSAEPLKTLSGYRNLNNKIMFGQNLLHKGSGIIKVGMEIKVKTVKEKILG